MLGTRAIENILRYYKNITPHILIQKNIGTQLKFF